MEMSSECLEDSFVLVCYRLAVLCFFFILHRKYYVYNRCLMSMKCFINCNTVMHQLMMGYVLRNS